MIPCLDCTHLEKLISEEMHLTEWISRSINAHESKPLMTYLRSQIEGNSVKVINLLISLCIYVHRYFLMCNWFNNDDKSWRGVEEHIGYSVELNKYIMETITSKRVFHPA